MDTRSVIFDANCSNWIARVFSCLHGQATAAAPTTDCVGEQAKSVVQTTTTNFPCLFAPSTFSHLLFNTNTLIIGPLVVQPHSPLKPLTPTGHSVSSFLDSLCLQQQPVIIKPWTHCSGFSVQGTNYRTWQRQTSTCTCTCTCTVTQIHICMQAHGHKHTRTTVHTLLCQYVMIYLLPVNVHSVHTCIMRLMREWSPSINIHVHITYSYEISNRAQEKGLNFPYCSLCSTVTMNQQGREVLG